MGSDAPDVFKQAALCGTHHIHHLVGPGPLLRGEQHFLEKPLAVFVLHQLEVVRALVACQGKQDDPFVFVFQERSDGIFSHVRSYGEGVDVHLLEERAGIHGRRVANISAFGIGDDELVGVVLLDVPDGFVKSFPTFQTIAFVEGQVGLIGHAIRGCGIDDSAVEGEDGILLLQEMGRDFFKVGVQPDAQERLLPADVADKLFSVHDVTYVGLYMFV